MAEKIIYEFEAKTAKAGKNVDKLKGKVKEVGKQSNKTGGGLKAVFKGLSNSIAGSIPMLGKLKTALVSSGVGAIVVALGSMVALFKSAATTGADFQKSISTLNAITGGDDPIGIKALSDQAKQLGSSTQFTAIEVVKLQTELAKLGFNIGDIQNSTPAILDLAASLEVDLASAAELAGSTVRAFGLDTTDSQRVVDIMALSTSKSALNFESLRESFKLVAPTSRAAGVSIEKTTALLGVLANNGLKGSVAGTGLSKTFIELNKKGLTLEQGMEKIKNSSNKLNTAIDLVGIVGAKSFLSLAESGDQIKELTKDLSDVEGSARSLAELRMDNLAGDITKLGSAWEGFLLGIEDGDGVINKIQRLLVSGLTASINALGLIIDYTGFSFSEFWKNTKLTSSGSVEFLAGVFSRLGGYMSKFANEALLSLADVPFIGKSIDKQATLARLKEAEVLLFESTQKINQGLEKIEQANTNRKTKLARFNALQAEKSKKIQAVKDAKINKAANEQADKINKEKTEAEIEAEKEKQKALEDIRKGFVITEDDKRAEALLKIQRDYDRRIELAEKYYGKESEKVLALRKANKEAIDAQQSIFDAKDKEKKDQDEAKAKADAQSKEGQERQKKIDAITIQLEDDQLTFENKRALLQERATLLLEDESLDAVQRVAVTTRTSRAIEREEQALADAKLAIQNATLGAVSTGFSLLAQAGEGNKKVQAAALIGENAAGIATNVINTQAANAKLTLQGGIGAPALIAANQIRMGVGIATSIAATAKGLKALGQGGSPSASGGSIANKAPSSPTFNVVGQSPNSVGNALAVSNNQIENNNNNPQRAYVVSTDLTNQQALDREIESQGSIG